VLGDFVIRSCDDGDGSVVWGVVRGSEGIPLPGAQVYRAGGNTCGALADSIGGYALGGLEPGDSIRVELIFYGSYSFAVPIAPDTTRIDPVLSGAPLGRRVTSHYDLLDRRPPAAHAPSGHAGCYWLGYLPPELASAGRIIELWHDGVVHPVVNPDFPMTWSWEPVPRHLVLRLTPGSLFAHSSGRIELGETPDWSEIPFSVRSVSDNLGPTQIHESFAVRVECERPAGAF
jgi:hypothetical protein